MKNFLILLVAYFAGMFTISMGADVMSETIIQEARTKASLQVQKMNELRAYSSKLIEFFEDNNIYLQPKLVGLADGQSGAFAYQKRKTYTVQTARACSRTGEQSGTGLASLSFVERQVSIKIQMSQALKNMYSFEEILANEMLNAEESLWRTGTNSVNNYLSAYLNANTSTVNLADGLDGTLNGDIMEIAKEDIPAFYALVRSQMGVNNYEGVMLNDVHDAMWAFTHQKSQYTNAATSLIDAATAQGVKTYNSNSLNALVTGTYGSAHYIVPQGGVGIVWVDPAIFAEEKFGNFGDYYRTKMDSLLYPGKSLSVKISKACADTTPDGGRTDDDIYTIDLSVQFAVLKAILSTANETVIYQYQTLNS